MTIEQMASRIDFDPGASAWPLLQTGVAGTLIVLAIIVVPLVLAAWPRRPAK